MQNNQENQSSSLERRVDLSVAKADIEKDVDARLKRMARTVKMPGFRPGKVPLKIVAQNYGLAAHQEALGAAVEKAFVEAVNEQKVRVAGSPRIEPRDGTDSEFAFSAVFEVYPTIELGDLSQQQIERPNVTVGDNEVAQTIDVLRKQRATFQEAARAAQDGDRVTVDFLGRKDGEPFDGGKAEGFPFILGAGSMLKDFEAVALGMAAGESKTFDMTFPEDYHAAHLAGQTVQFDISMNKVEEPVLPALDADFAKMLGIGSGDISGLREEVEKNLQREVKRRVQARVKEQAMDALLAAHPIDVPKALVDAEAEKLAENARNDFASRGMQIRDIPVDASWFSEQAVRRVKLGLILAEVVNAKELYAKPEQVKALVEDMAQSYEDPAELVRWYYSQPERLAQAEAVVIEDNVVAWVEEQAQTTAKDVNFDEFMGNPKAPA